MRQLGARLGLGNQPRYEPLRDLRVKHRLNSVINIGCVGSSIADKKTQLL